MNFFNRERKVFTDQPKPKDQKSVTSLIHPPFEMTKPLTQEGTSRRSTQGQGAKNQNTKGGTVIFTNQANLFTPQELDDFFEQIAFLMNGEKTYGRLKTPEIIQAHYEQGLSIIGVSEYQVWGHVCLCPLQPDMYALEAAIRSDFRDTEAAKRLVDLFVRRESHQEKTIYAISWTPYTKRLFRELAWVPCQLQALEQQTREALKGYDEFVEQYDLFSRHLLQRGED
ncbi:hypothetical protein HYR99_33665 [Candidatus Poribacteria bacterium]|nr:hypothetical protein [Candidatus Poribacteria bacterium]